MIWLVPLGVAAGALTTLSGFGGGLLVVIALSLWLGPKAALAVSALALLFGNGHRLWLFRAHLEPRVMRPILVGVIPGSLLGALFAVGMPELVLRILLCAAVVLVLARVLGYLTWTPSPRTLTAAAFAIGALAGTTGGIGLLVAPLILATGLEGRAYLATAASAGVAMHTARILGYTMGGLYDGQAVRFAGILAVTLMVGNLAGDWLRQRISDKYLRLLEIATPLVAAVLAVAGAT